MAIPADSTFWKAESVEFARLWNAVSKVWNEIAADTESGMFPYGKLVALDKEIDRLRRSSLWPKKPKKD